MTSFTLSEYSHYSIDCPGKPSLRVEARPLASVASWGDPSDPRFSGDPDRWEILTLDETASAKYVALRIRLTRRKDECDHVDDDVDVGVEVEILDSPAAVREYFGDGWLARELYEDAGIGVGVIDVA